MKNISKIRKNAYIIFREKDQNESFYEKIGIFCNECSYLLIDIDDEVVCCKCLKRLKRKNDRL
jgi:hypothetical protein